MVSDEHMIAWRNEKRASRACFALILVLQLLVIVHFANEKQGFFIDELWSYGLANSYFFPHVDWNGAWDHTWIYPDMLYRYLQVDKGESFRYDSVVFNLLNDAHPPTFFIVLHTVSSFFPEQFSKWFGIAPNICYFAILQVFLYRLSIRLFNGRWLALVPVVLWGFSAGAISYVIFIRMYMLCAMVLLIWLNLLYEVIAPGSAGKPVWILLGCCAFAGYMCHYYFFIVAFVFSVAVELFFIFSRQWRKGVLYAVSMLFSLLLVVLAFPSAFSNVFGNRYSQEATAGFLFGAFVDKMKGFMHLLLSDFFFNLKFVSFFILCLVILAVIVGLVSSLRGHQNPTGGQLAFVVIVAISSLLFFAVAAHVSPFISARYTCIVYPLFVLWSTWFVFWGFGDLSKRFPWIAAVFGTSLLLYALVLNFFTYPSCIDYLYPEAMANLEAIEKQDDPQVLFVTYYPYVLTGKALELEHVEKVWTTGPDGDGIAEAVGYLDQSRQ